MRRTLSIELEEHLVNQVLKVEDGRFAYTDDALVLVVHILIIRTSTGSSLGDHSLRLKICKGYAGFGSKIARKHNLALFICIA